MVSVYVNQFHKNMCDTAFSQAGFYWNQKITYFNQVKHVFIKK